MYFTRKSIHISKQGQRQKLQWGLSQLGLAYIRCNNSLGRNKLLNGVVQCQWWPRHQHLRPQMCLSKRDSCQASRMFPSINAPRSLLHVAVLLDLKEKQHWNLPSPGHKKLQFIVLNGEAKELVSYGSTLSRCSLVVITAQPWKKMVINVLKWENPH